MKHLIYIGLLLVSLGATSFSATATSAVDDANLVDSLKTDTLYNGTQLREVVVAATTSRRPGSASVIGRDAMSHLQPSSFVDLLELLPGHMSKSPDFSKANTITLRETGSVSATGQQSQLSANYAMTSLGTLFMVDGAPLITDGNVQAISGTETRGSTVNRGLDMRTIATDNINKVEVVQGIPSAEYGNLTSGVVNISRIYSATPLSARLKVDGFSKLASVAKGVAVGRHSINADAGWLDSRSDPRDPRDSYRRVNASLRGRFSLGSTESAIGTRLTIGVDYTGSYDDIKTDADLQSTKIDDFKSSYSQIGLTAQSDFTLNRSRLFRLITLSASLRETREVVEQHKQVAPQRAAIAPTTMYAGENLGEFLVGEYIADFKSDSRPINANAKITGYGTFSIAAGDHRWKVGVDYQYVYNHGEGQIYDLTRPLSGGWTTRPRRYSDIPSQVTISGFAEDNARWIVGESAIDAQIGVRLISMPLLDKRYYLSHRVYADPRCNINWSADVAEISNLPLRLTLGVGYGIATRMPTADYLFPQTQYLDMVQLNYYHQDQSTCSSLVSLRTYLADASNYKLRAARNAKYEFRTALDLGSNRLGITAFYERMKSGYRYMTAYQPYDYKLYSPSEVNPQIGADQLSDISFTNQKVLRGISRPDNGTRIDKLGIEYQLQTARISVLHTAVTVTGAWLRTRYSNSRQLFDPVSVVIGQLPVSDKYVGLYDSDEGRINSQLNTNIMFDSQWPRYGMIFTTSLQCLWWVKTKRMAQNGMPVAYISAEDGLIHPFTANDQTDAVLKQLVQHYNSELYRQQTVPPALYLNLRVSKQIGKALRMAAFVNSLLDYLPDYTVNGLMVRRGGEAYFGMEAIINI